MDEGSIRFHMIVSHENISDRVTTNIFLTLVMAESLSRVGQS